MTGGTLFALLAFLFPLAYSPGPGNTFFAAIGASKGLRAAVPGLIGYHLATFVVTAAVGLGVGAAVLDHPAFMRVLGAAGSLYVLWLASTFLRSGVKKLEPGEHAEGPQEKIGFVAGAVVLLLNPKAYYIIALMFTQFLDPGQDRVIAVLAITAVFTVNNLIAFTVWNLAGTALTLLFRSDRARRWIDVLFAVTLIAVAIWMAIPLLA